MAIHKALKRIRCLPPGKNGSTVEDEKRTDGTENVVSADEERRRQKTIPHEMPERS